jgi:hypothetical protein
MVDSSVSAWRDRGGVEAMLTLTSAKPSD